VTREGHQGQSVPYPPQPSAPAYPPVAPGSGPGTPSPHGGVPVAPPRDAQSRPRRVESVPGTPYGLVYLDVPPVTSGLAVGSLVVGISAIGVAFAVACFGLVGIAGGWGAWVAGAFALLGTVLGLAGVALGLLGQRQIGRAAPPPALRFTGRGLAIAGVTCAAVGLGVTILAFLLVLVLQLA
jgi:hypothetical protein